jgi:pimeloyl-ACP methyl ester carboxylesterase
MKVSAAEQLVRMVVGSAQLEGNLSLPQDASGVVLFAHGSGSSRHSPRNQYVAQALHEGGMGTLLMDLLTATEEREDARTARLRFDIALLAARVVGASDWLTRNTATAQLPIGYFGASTGAAAALAAAAERPDYVRAVVSRGGRPDLAIPVLNRVKGPTLLIVGGADVAVIEMNRDALKHLSVEKRLEIIPGLRILSRSRGLSRKSPVWRVSGSKRI